MAITFISRDYGVNVSIVRITTTDTTGIAAAPGYITAQTANIDIANNGPFTWQTGDEVLVQAADGNAFFQISPDFSSLLPNYSSSYLHTTLGLVALVGGGQTGATQLNSGFNVIATVATASDSVLLPANVLGNVVTVFNNGANAVGVYPSLGGSINTAGVNGEYIQAATTVTTYYGVSATNWRTK